MPGGEAHVQVHWPNQAAVAACRRYEVHSLDHSDRLRLIARSPKMDIVPSESR